ncbi:hypothetical protein [Acidithiobacillus thiooxidans]|uniref:hypothetical protein n=1 Tax=Acidithiobacillus thiooxidans TaxID=930 RepID=UPI001C0676F6|nr:hypothetical protein [Acidithiobacillus thiooxidans]MBU2843540.1 hypothetical protein [Acidithiobacillus thiooxidans]
MSNALSTQNKPQTVFTRRDLNQKSRDLLSRMQAYLKGFDAREPQYMPRRKITAIGAALLMHREIERMDAKKYHVDIDVEALDDMEIDVKRGEA